MKTLDRKMMRDLMSMRGQAVAIALVIVAGVATFVTMTSVMDALQRTLDAYYRDYRFADGFASVRRAPEGVAELLRAVPGVDVLETRVTAPANLEVAGFDEPVTALLVSVPAGGQPMLNRLVVREGRLLRLEHEGEVVLNEAFAEAHGLGPGARLVAIVGGRRRTLTVVGVALSPEHLLQVQPGSLFPDAERFGVLWMGREALAAARDMEGAFNDIAFTLAPGASSAGVIERVDRILARYGGTGAIPRSKQLSNFAIGEEFRQLRGTATLLPVIFLGVAAFLLNIVITRLISLQRDQVGVLKAFGYGNVAVGGHYGKLVLIIALVGAAVGTGLGLWLGRLMGDVYLEYYRFPAIDYRPQPGVVLTAVLLTVGASLAGVVRAVVKAVQLPPATAMRPAPPAVYRRSLAERFGLGHLLDQPTRMILRSLARQPLRAGLTVVGISASCAILIMGLFFTDSFEFILRTQYGVAQRENVTVAFVEPSSYGALYELRALPGVLYAEPFRAVPVRLRHRHRIYDTGIQGLPPDPYLRRIIDRDERPIAIPSAGLVLTERLAEILHARPGDEVIVEVREGSRSTRTVRVAALTRQLIGVAAYMDLEALNRIAGAGRAISGAYLMTDTRAEPLLNATLRDRPRVASIVSQERTMEAFSESAERSMLTFTFILSLFAGVIAFGVVYNSARISLSERDRELASLRVLGFTRGEVSYILLGELGMLTLAAVPLGFGLGAVLSGFVVRSLQTDLYQFPLVLGRSTFGLAAAVVIGAAMISALIVRRRLSRLDLVGVLKTRE